jgi:hypothetical protein
MTSLMTRVYILDDACVHDWQVVDAAWTREVTDLWNDRPAFLAAEPHALRQGEQASQPKQLHGVVIQVPKRKEFFFCELFF